MAKFDLNLYARRGAELRIAELHQELESIYSAFPELRAAGRGRGGRRPRGRAATAAAAATPASAGAAPRAARRKRPAMSAAQRRAVSLRMKKYWAERRKSKEK